MDWPLSKDEKKRRVLELYSQDERVSQEMLSSSQAAIAALKTELEAVRSEGKSLRDHQLDVSAHSERMWKAVEAASAVLRAVVPDHDEDVEDAAADFQPSKQRSRSGPSHSSAPAVPSKPVRTPRHRRSLDGKRQVSFTELPAEDLETEPRKKS